MTQDCTGKYFHIGWLVVSILSGVFVVYQIGPQVIYLRPVVITSGDPVEALKNCGESCSVSGQLLDIDKLNFSDQLDGFDNFFPLSAISRYDLSINYTLEGNIFFEVTNPKYSEKIKDMAITCNNQTSPKYSSDKQYEKISGVKSYSINERLSEYFLCLKPGFNFSYKPNTKVEIEPYEYVKFTTQGKDAIVIFDNLSVALTPNFLTKFLIFLIYFFLSLGAGSILYPYLCNSGLIPGSVNKGNQKKFIGLDG